MFIEILVIVILLLFLLLMLIYSKKEKPSRQSFWDDIREEKLPVYRLCPLCKSPLEKGENVYSHLYPGHPDGMMHIFGCPHCYDKDRSMAIQRYCPYCHEALSQEGYVIARVFQKPGKTQVHVLGCTGCRLRNSEN
ncbi:MAG: hypothetical protein PF447_14760 [Spirochaetaceae bacterium]|nr:hypothetical protein [Spirochaetaceae bacterium]